MKRQIDWGRLKNVGTTLKPFQPTKENIDFLSDWLMNGFLTISDENRTWEKIRMRMGYYFPYHMPPEIRPLHIIYEIGDFAGILGFMDIAIGYKASVLFKYWKPESWSHKIFRDLKKVNEVIIEELQLDRLSLQTPDLRGVALAKRLNYTVEGREAINFSWNGKYYTNHLLRRLSPEREKKRLDRRTARNNSVLTEE